LENLKAVDSKELDPWSLFIYAMKAPMTRDRYQTRVAKFFDFAGISGTTLEEKARNSAALLLCFLECGADNSH
jgi:hypothetical protein